MFLDNRLSEKDIKNLSDFNYSKKTFDINFPLLKKQVKDSKTDKNGKDKKGHARYYTKLYKDNYLLCKEWFEGSKKPFLEWLKKYE